MALLDDLNTASLLDSKFNKRCGMCRLLEKLSPAEAEKVVELMNNPDIAKSKLTRVLQQNGHIINSGVLTRHARGECAG